MSVIVIGMDMPESCDICSYMKTNDDLMSDDYRYMYCNHPYMGEFVSDYVATRHPNCPLKSVEGLIEEIKKHSDRLKDSLYGDGLRHCIEIIEEYCEVDT